MINLLVEVKLKEPDAFLKTKETLTRVGIPSYRDKKLFQSCHILHKRGKYYIVHFKELFALDGKPASISNDDLERRNLIISLLEDWGLVTVIDEEKIANKAHVSTVKVIPYKEKHEWELIQKYTIGNK